MVILFFGLPLLFGLLILVLPKPMIGFLEQLLIKALDVENFNETGHYNHSGYRPIYKEHQGVSLEIKGKLPDDLSGAYIRNGTNSQFMQTKSRHHAFNGAGMLHQVQFKNGEARYSNCFVRTDRFLAEENAGEELYPEFGNLVGTGKAGMFTVLIGLLKQRFKLVSKSTPLRDGSSTTSVMYHHGKFYALQETSLPFAMNCQDDNGWLRIDGSGDWDSFGDKLDKPYTAHPKVDPKTGDIHSFSTHLQSGDVYYDVLSAGQLIRHNYICTAKPAIAFVHDYYLTENYIIFPEVSLRFNPKEFFGEHKSMFYFDEDKPLRFGVIDRRHGGDVRWFETKAPRHIWHTVNGWEETQADGGTDILLYAPVFSDYPSDIPIHSAKEPHATFMRFRLNLEAGTVTEEKTLLSHFYERPSINSQYLGQKQRYAYLLDEGRGGIMGKGVLKYDMLNEAELDYFDYEDAFGGEALFVPKAEAKAEDDGYLIELLMREDTAELLVLDAKKMSELARLKLPQRVPFGVHSTWLNDAEIQNLINKET